MAPLGVSSYSEHHKGSEMCNIGFFAFDCTWEAPEGCKLLPRGVGIICRHVLGISKTFESIVHFPMMCLFPVEALSCMFGPRQWYQTDHMERGEIFWFGGTK